jgi:hypothetical protein
MQVDGKSEVQPVPRARTGLLFEAFSILLTEKEMSISSVAGTLKVYALRIWGIFNYRVERAHKKDIPKNLMQAGFDGTSQKKGYNYITLSRFTGTTGAFDRQLYRTGEQRYKIASITQTDLLRLQPDSVKYKK